jgi:Uma2 family endonuclease
MTLSSSKISEITLAEYLDYDDGTGTRYELVDGILVNMGNESKINIQIAMFLLYRLAEIGIPEQHLSVKTEIVVPSRKVKVRYPDLVILTDELEAQMDDGYRNIIQIQMPPPAMVAEVVSPGDVHEENYQRDYIDKVQEYAERGIPEYWIIDPMREVVLVLTLVEGNYEFVSFKGSDRIISPAFPSLVLSAEGSTGSTMRSYSLDASR